MLSINFWNILFTVVNVLFLYWVFKKFMFKPVMNVISKREAMVNEQFETAKANEEQAEQMRQEYEKKLMTAKEQAEEIIVTAKNRAAEEKAKALEETQKETARMLEKAKADIKSEQQKAQQEVQVEIAKLAMTAARKIMKTGDMHDTGSKE